MEHNAKALLLFQTTVSLWFLVLVFVVLGWAWILFYHQETWGRKKPGINIKEL